MRKYAPSILHCLRVICTTTPLWAAMALPVSASAATFPEAKSLHAAYDLTAILTVGGFLMILAGMGCLKLIRRKRRVSAVAFCCLLPVFVELVLVSAPTLTAWYSCRAQKTVANAYLACTAAMDEAVVKQAHHAADYNLALAESRTAVGNDGLAGKNSVIAVLELLAIGQTLPVYLGTEAGAPRHGVDCCRKAPCRLAELEPAPC